MTTSSSIILQNMVTFDPIVTFLPTVTDWGTPTGWETLAFKVDPCPTELKCPIQIGPISALKTALYHTVAHFEMLTSPARVALGAIQASSAWGLPLRIGSICQCLGSVYRKAISYDSLEPDLSRESPPSTKVLPKLYLTLQLTSDNKAPNEFIIIIISS